MPAGADARLSSMVQERRTPAVLSISDIVDDDAFDAKDDYPDQLPYVFSPDAIREDLAKNMPGINESWVEEAAESFPQGEPFDGDSQNLSVSTLDIGPSVLPPSFSEELSEDSTADSSNSPEFSQIPLSASHNGLESDDKNSWDGNANFVRHRPPSLDLHRGGGPSSSAPRTVLSPQDSPGFSATLSTGSALHSAGFSEKSERSSSIQSPSSAGSEASPSTSLPNMSTVPAVAAGSTLLTEKTFGHRPARSLGPSVFEKVRSKTRPTFLPPKSRKEDDKHMSDWQLMMKQSRLVGAFVS